MAGLYAYYHYEPLSSRSFIPANKIKVSLGLSPEDIINLKVDAMRILQALKNPNKREAFMLLVQGYTYEEIGKKLNLSPDTIRKRYIENMRKLLNGGTVL